MFFDGYFYLNEFCKPLSKEHSCRIIMCVKCRKLCGRFQEQLMADLPADPVNFAPPLSCTGVHVFGPWTVARRRTCGRVMNSKRWAMIFTCLTIHAIHIEIID